MKGAKSIKTKDARTTTVKEPTTIYQLNQSQNLQRNLPNSFLHNFRQIKLSPPKKRTPKKEITTRQTVTS